MAEYYQYVKAMHIVFVISWMAGLFYLVRIFVYITEANNKVEPARSILLDEYKANATRLLNIITTPAMLIALMAGVTMLLINPALLTASWMHVKLTFVFMLISYHIISVRILSQLKNGRYSLKSIQLRLFNEVATMLMVAIVFVVILKNAINWLYGLGAFILLGITLMVAVKLYRKARLKTKPQ